MSLDVMSICIVIDVCMYLSCLATRSVPTFITECHVI